MIVNMGRWDRGLRFVVGIALAFLYISGEISGLLGLALGLVAAVFILTSSVGFCPLYSVFHWNTKGPAGSH
jgi:hypothetical protein